jgi:hypothetical protein
MNISILSAILLSLGTAFIGYSAGKIGGRITHVQDGSLAGQTLTNVARALAIHRDSEGSYPESLDGITVQPEGGKHSELFLRHVIYRRTERGYLAFVGVRGVAYIEPGQGCVFVEVR